MASFVMEAIFALETGSLLFTIAFSCRSTRNGIKYHMYFFHDSRRLYDQKLCKTDPHTSLRKLVTVSMILSW